MWILNIVQHMDIMMNFGQVYIYMSIQRHKIMMIADIHFIILNGLMVTMHIVGRIHLVEPARENMENMDIEAIYGTKNIYIKIIFWRKW